MGSSTLPKLTCLIWITGVTMDTKPSNLNAADKKTVEDAEEAAATLED
jgi:hypothetical protein